MHKHILGALTILFVFLFTSLASADVAPPNGYEEECTMEKQHHNDMACISCNGGGAVQPGDEGACDTDAYAADGYEYVCNSLGASYNTEIWCKDSPGEVGPAGDPQEDSDEDSDDSGCTIAAPGATTAGWFIALIAILAMIRIYRARKDPQ